MNLKFWRRWTKKKDPDFFNVHHAKYVNEVETAFETGGIQYYRMKEEVKMPYGRYKHVSAALYEVNLRMDLATLKGYIKAIMENIDGSRDKINLIKVGQLLLNMESRIELQFTPETAKRLASIVYFDETEDLTDFDDVYAKKKLAIWEREGGHDFFLTKPMDELLGLKGISPDSLTEFIKVAEEVIKESTLGMQSPASQSSE